MSLLFYAPAKLIAKSEHREHREPTTTFIILVSAAIFIGIIILMYAGIMYTETTKKQYSDCRSKIVGFEQSGMYVNSDKFKLALSYCNVR